MAGRPLVVVACGVVVAALLISVATAGEVQIAERSPTWPWTPESSGGGQTQDQDEQIGGRLDDLKRPYTPGSLRLPGQTTEFVLILLGAALVAIAVAAWRRRPRLRWRGGEEGHDLVVLDDVVASMNADAAAQRELLLSGEPRNAIVACWLRMTALIAASGLEPDPSETSEEFTTRVLTRFAVNPLAIDRLAALYREARFSSHAIDEERRVEAIEMLDAIHDGLRSAHGAPV